MTQTAVSSVLLVIVLVLLVIIFSCLYYLWDKTRKLELLTIKSANSKPVHQTNGHICGYAGKELFDVLRDRKESPQLIEEMKKHDIINHLDSIKSPTLIIGGDKDKIIPNKYQFALDQILSNSEIYIIKDGSHVPQADFPKLINERIQLFIDEITISN